jgi:hypothetical protein
MLYTSPHSLFSFSKTSPVAPGLDKDHTFSATQHAKTPLNYRFYQTIFRFSIDPLSKKIKDYLPFFQLICQFLLKTGLFAR